jgi:hypothetical protein
MVKPNLNLTDFEPTRPLFMNYKYVLKKIEKK